MSRIMRQLEAEARASREAAREKELWDAVDSTPAAPPPPDKCPHGIAWADACYACGRFAKQLEFDFDFVP